MSKGFEKNKKRKMELNSYIKQLIKRSKSCCELCNAKGESIDIYEVPPVEEDVEFEKLLMICKTCNEKINKIEKKNNEEYNFLKNSIWSELKPVKILSAKLLKILSQKKFWASELLEEIYFDEMEEEWLNKIS